MKRNLTPIASAVALLMLSATVHAQEANTTSAPAAGAPEVQAVVVTGIRASLEKSLEQKRNAESHLDVLTAEDIGKMPDKNVADSLQRIPGVTTSSAQGSEGGFDENDRVSMRGTGSSLTQTLVNGHNLASGDWFVLGQTAGLVGRSVSYTLLPSEIVGQVEVHKSSEASLVEGGVAGSVDIKTRKPLDFANPLTVEGSVGGVYSTQASKTDPQFSGMVNWKNDQNNLGVLVQVFNETRNLVREGQEVLGYSQIAPGSKIATSNPDLSGAWYPSLIGSAYFQQKRVRTGGLFDVEMKPSSGLTVDLNGFSSKVNASNTNDNFMFWGDSIVNHGAGLAPLPGYTVKNTNGISTLTSAQFAALPGTNYGVYDQIARPDEGSSSNYVDLDVTWRVTDHLKLKSSLGTSIGHGRTPIQDVAETNVTGTGAAYQLNGISSGANVNFGNNNNASQAPNTTFGWIFGDQFTDVIDTEKWGQIDGEYALNEGVFRTLQFGIREADHSRSSAGVVGQGAGCAGPNGWEPFKWSVPVTYCPAGATSPYTISTLPPASGSYPSNFGAGLGGTFPNNVWTNSTAQLAAYDALYATRATDGSRDDWGSDYSLQEKSQAAYGQANLAGDGWSGNFGLRFVRTLEDVTNNVGTPTGTITTSAFGPYNVVHTNSTYNDVLPSANLRFDVTKDLVARVAASSTMTRPDYGALAGSVSLGTPPADPSTTGVGSGANPKLKPIKSNNLDATLEWYFAPKSLASVGVYYMDLTSYVGYGVANQSYFTTAQQYPQGAQVGYAVTVPVNTTGFVKGLELSLEMPVYQNFGFSSNFTLNDARDTGDGPTAMANGNLIGASKQSGSLSGYFENDTYNARVTYSYRSSNFVGLDSALPFYQAGSGELAASFGYKINDHLALSLDAQNLNNPKLRYYAQNEDEMRAVYKNGQQFYLTLRGKM